MLRGGLWLPNPKPQRARLLIPDPPWEYNNRHETRQDNGQSVKGGAGVSHRYSAGCMDLARLKTLSHLIQQVTTDDAYCLMWTTCPHMEEALELMSAWGFEYKTIAFAWVKTYRGSTRPFSGLGKYTASNLEPVLIGARSGCWHNNEGGMAGQIVSSDFWDEEAFFAAHPRDENDKIIHSRKPPEFWDRVNNWLPRAPKLELFATEGSGDRICLGHELSGRDIAVDLAILASQIQAAEAESKPKISFNFNPKT